MTLQTGTYVPKNQVRVTVWPAPDVNGDGEDLFVDQYDEGGNYLGREPVEEAGKPVRLYQAPEGFVRVPTTNPGQDGAAEAWVRSNGRGQVHRNAQGEAVGIKPGSALLEYPDGTHKLLDSGYAQRQFENAHTLQENTTEGAPS